jgi:hypothetical protein
VQTTVAAMKSASKQIKTEFKKMNLNEIEVSGHSTTLSSVIAFANSERDTMQHFVILFVVIQRTPQSIRVSTPL